MKKETLNKALLLVSVLVSVSIISWAIYKLATKDNEDNEDNQDEADEEAPAVQDPFAPINPSATGQPVFDRNNQLSNPLSELRGKVIYPKGGSANVRTENFVNDGFVNNKIVTITGSNTPIGAIMTESKGQEDPPMRWFRVLLAKPITVGIWPFYTEIKDGWVRADVVTFKK